MCLFHVGGFNAEYPLEVDDDFWENDDPQHVFVQPYDKPLTVITFNLWLRPDLAASTLQSLVSPLYYSLFVSSFVSPEDIPEHDGSCSGLRVQDKLNRDPQ